MITLCTVDGIAAAAGLQLALTCDLLLASEKSSFSTPGIKWGLFCSTPGVQLVRSMAAEKKAREMLLFGESISAQEAYQYGLVNKVVPEGQMHTTVEDYISKAKQLSGEVLTLGKAALDQQLTAPDLASAYCLAGKAMHDNITNKSDCK